MSNEEVILTTKVSPLRLKSVAQPWSLFLTGDIHQGVDNHHNTGYRKMISECVKMKAKKQPFKVIYTGDENDIASGSERAGMMAANLHGGTIKTMDQMFAEKCDELIEMNKPIAEEIIGWVQGNHFWRFSTSNTRKGYHEGMTSTEYICRKLGNHWLGFMSCIVISAKDDNNVQVPYKVVVCHGKTACATAGGAINQVQNLRKIWPLADTYCLAHDHKLLAVKEPQLDIDVSPKSACDYSTSNMEHFRVTSKDQILCRSGSQLKSYEPGVPSYAVGRMYHPSSLGCVTIEVKGHRRMTDGGRNFEWEHTARI